MIPEAADCFWVSAISRTKMYEVGVLFCDETNEARLETQQSDQRKVLPTNSSDGLTHVESNSTGNTSTTTPQPQG